MFSPLSEVRVEPRVHLQGIFGYSSSFGSRTHIHIFDRRSRALVQAKQKWKRRSLSDQEALFSCHIRRFCSRLSTPRGCKSMNLPPCSRYLISSAWHCPRRPLPSTLDRVIPVLTSGHVTGKACSMSPCRQSTSLSVRRVARRLSPLCHQSLEPALVATAMQPLGDTSTWLIDPKTPAEVFESKKRLRSAPLSDSAFR
jgi:hypothetical protein